MSTCTVGCKVPNGLILEIGERGTDTYKQVVLRGQSAGNIVGGFGLTENVDENAFDRWLETNKALPWAKQGLVFKMRNTTEASARALDHSEQKTGLERLTPDKLPGGVAEDADAMKKVRAATK